MSNKWKYIFPFSSSDSEGGARGEEGTKGEDPSATPTPLETDITKGIFGEIADMSSWVCLL